MGFKNGGNPKQKVWREGKQNQQKTSDKANWRRATYARAVDLGLDKVVAVDGGGDGDAGQARADELKHGHLKLEAEVRGLL